MPIAIAIIGFLILLGFSGGVNGGLAPQSNASSTTTRQSAVASDTRSNSSSNRPTRSLSNSRFSDSFSLGRETNATAVDFLTPSITALSARNLETTSATLRGSVLMRTYKNGTVFAVYGYSERRVDDLAKKYRSTVEAPDTDDRARVIIFDSRANNSEAYERRVSNLASDTRYFVRVCVEYTTLGGALTSVCDSTSSFTTNPAFSLSNNRFREPSIYLQNILNVTDSEASLSGRVTMNDGREGIPFILYGQSENLIQAVSENSDTFSGVREADEDLQKVRIATGLRGGYDFSLQLTDLDNNEQYFYRACVEYDGERDGLICDGVQNFTTDARDKSNKPTAVTGSASVAGTRATLGGSVDMEDFFDGVAFFVYGTDKSRISTIEDEGSFDSISQSIDRLQRVSVDDDLDGSSSYSRTISDLLPTTPYYYRMCVQYKDENERGRDEFFLRCGMTKSFVSGR